MTKKSNKIQWDDYHFTLNRNVNAKPILEHIHDNLITEFLAYDEKYWYNVEPDSGPLRGISFKAPSVDTLDIYELILKKFPKAIVTGGSHPFKWLAGGKLSVEQIEQVKKIHKENKFK